MHHRPGDAGESSRARERGAVRSHRRSAPRALSPRRGLPRVPARDHRTRKLTHYPDGRRLTREGKSQSMNGMSIDPAYQTVARDDFPAMIEPDRYARRSPLFEEIIARTEEHFWNPEDPDYIDYGA